MPVKKHPEHVNLERWLVSYADFVTLLFAFFVVMFASARVDTKKLKEVVTSVRRAFGGDVVEQGAKSGGKSLNQFAMDLPVGGVAVDLPIGRVNVQVPDYESLKRVADILEESVAFDLGKSDHSEKLELTYDNRGLVVRLSAKGFYDEGEVVVRQDALPILDQVAKVLKTAERPIRIEGHTADEAANSTMYPSNWELSTARSAWLLRYLIKKFEFDPKLLEASGMAQYRPIAPNNTVEGRAKNRRVEIVVLSKQSP